MLKKLFLFLICIQFALINIVLPALAVDTNANTNANINANISVNTNVNSDYDFSDSAQMQFDQNRFVPVVVNEVAPINAGDIKRKQQKNVKKNVKNEMKNEIKNEMQKTEEINNFNNFDNTPELFRTEPQTFYTPELNATIDNNSLKGAIFTVPAGTQIVLTFDSGISSGSMDKNDKLTTSLSKDFVSNGRLVAPKGSLVYGIATDAKSAGHAYESGAIELYFDKILTPDGTLINISTEKIVLAEENGQVKFMARDLLIGAGVGILAGALFALLGDGNYMTAMITSGSIGLLSGGVSGFMHLGKNIQIPDGTQLNVRLANPINISTYH